MAGVLNVNSLIYSPLSSSIPTHIDHLLSGQDIDLWLLFVFREFGLGVFLLTLTVPLMLFTIALRLLASSRLLSIGNRGG